MQFAVILNHFLNKYPRFSNIKKIQKDALKKASLICLVLSKAKYLTHYLFLILSNNLIISAKPKNSVPLIKEIPQ